MRYEDAVSALATATNWHKSTYSQGGENACVEVGSVPGLGLVGVRDTKRGAASPTLPFGAAQWQAFVAMVRPADQES